MNNKNASGQAWVSFLCGPYGLLIISLIASFFFIAEAIGAGDWIFYWGLDLALIVVAAAYTWRNWQRFVASASDKDLFFYGQKANLLLAAFAVLYISCLAFLYNSGAVGDARHELFRQNRLIDQLARIAQLGLEVCAWFSPVGKSIAISFGLVTSNAFFALSKGSLFNQTLMVVFIYVLKWRYSLTKSQNVLTMAIISATVIGGLEYTRINAERFGLDPSLIIQLGAKRLFFPNDIYLDFYNLPKGLLGSEAISPFVFLEFFSKPFYDETPFGTIGSVLRSGMENPDVVTGGTPYLSLHLAFMSYSRLYMILGLLFMVVCFAGLCVLARNPIGLPRQFAWLLIGVPGMYVNDYSGLSMRLLHILVLVVIFKLARLTEPGIAKREI